MSSPTSNENANNPVSIMDIITNPVDKPAMKEQKNEDGKQNEISDVIETPLNKTLMTEANNILVPEQSEDQGAEKQIKENEKSSEKLTNEKPNLPEENGNEPEKPIAVDENNEEKPENNEKQDQIQILNDQNPQKEEENTAETQQKIDGDPQDQESKEENIQKEGENKENQENDEIKENPELVENFEQKMNEMVGNKTDEQEEENIQKEEAKNNENNENSTENQQQNEKNENEQNSNENQEGNEIKSQENVAENQTEIENSNMENQNTNSNENLTQNEQKSNENLNEANQLQDQQIQQQPEGSQQEQTAQQETQEQDANQINNDVDNIEGMDVIDTFRYGTPNVGKRIDMSSLPLLETPFDVEASCQKQLEYFNKNHKFMESANIPQVLQYLQREKANNITKGEYMEAHKNEELIKKIIQYTNSVEQNQMKDTKTGELEIKINELDEEIKNTKIETENKIKNLKTQHDKNLSRLQQTQKEEMQTLERNWNDPNYLRKYEKPSAKLLQLSNVEHSLVSAGEFEKADEIKNEIDKLEVIESQEAQERAEKEMLSQQKKIMAKHDRENQLLEEQLQKEIEKVTIIADNKTRTIEDRKERVQKQLVFYQSAPAKLPPLKPKEKPDIIITPRTQQRMLICKQAKRNPRISVKPLGQLSLIAKKNKKKRSSSVLQF